MKKERWKAAPDFEGFYEVSNHGRVRRIAPAAKLPASKLPYILVGGHDERGYPQVNLSVQGTAYSRKIHRLVALAFIGPRPRGFQINHIDGDKKNNLVENLEYVTPKYNTIHGYTFEKRRAACPRGENHVNHIVTEYAVHVIRSGKYRTKELRRMFGISKSTVEHVRSRRSWKHIIP